jgi:Leucine-rich repeat (LRR) protein
MTNNDSQELTNFLDKYGIKYKVVGYRIVAGDVDLVFRGITQLPDSIYYLQCDYLRLNNNNIASLPNSIWNLKCKCLYLHYNNLTQLPESIGDLQCEYLYLYNNNLTSLPESFGNLKCKDLYLHNNNLTAASIELLEKMKSNGVDVIYQPTKQTNIGGNIMTNCANMVDPDHYKKGSFQTIDVIEEFLDNESRLLTEKQKYLIGNAIKYLSRAGLKGSTQEDAITDLKKAENYIHRAITGEWIDAS